MGAYPIVNRCCQLLNDAVSLSNMGRMHHQLIDALWMNWECLYTCVLEALHGASPAMLSLDCSVKSTAGDIDHGGQLFSLIRAFDGGQLL